MAVRPLTSDEFEDTVSGAGIVIVDCWAPWCGACKEFAPVFEAAAARHPDHVFATLNTEAETSIVEALGIKHIPSLLLFRDGILLFQQPGYFDPAGLDSVVSQAESLNMDMVRREIAAERDRDGGTDSNESSTG